MRISSVIIPAAYLLHQGAEGFAPQSFNKLFVPPVNVSSRRFASNDLNRPSTGLPWDKLTEQLEERPFRRLSDINSADYNQKEQKLNANDLVQMVLVKSSDKSVAVNKFGTIKNKYQPVAVDKAIDFLKNISSTKGINKTFVQYQPSSPDLSYKERIDEFCGMLSKMTENLPDVEVIVDPIAICIRPTLRWGVPISGTKVNESYGDRPEIDAKATLDVFKDAVGKISQSGVRGILTLGRINYEVAVAKDAIESSGKDTKVFSFSTNSETAFAYFSSVVDNPSKAETGQKLLVGNFNEMLSRALIDINEGSNVILQKPIENFAIPQALNAMQISKPYFLSVVKDSGVSEYLESYIDLHAPDGKIDFDSLYEKLTNIELGAYEVSGSGITQSLIADAWSDELALTLQNERYLTAQSASGNKLRYIVARDIDSYVDFQPKN